MPRDAVSVTTDPVRLHELADALSAGDGPIALDAERASGYRYGSRAYLVQLRREDVGTHLLDPVALGDLAVLQPGLAASEWVLHAATQDLPCLADAGLTPTRLFDTELAGRLAGYPRVGLGPLVEEVLGLGLQKGHGAADWSVRPLPHELLVYAALDVEVLVDLRDALTDVLRRQGKLDWALQEFSALVAAPRPAPRVDPWRRTSGIHKVHDRRTLAIIRELWEQRDEIAARRDLAPHRVLPDAAIVAAAAARPRTTADLVALPVFGGRAQRRQAAIWLAAIGRAGALRIGTCRPPTCPATDRPRPAVGRPRTRSPPPVWPWPGKASPRCRAVVHPGGEPHLARPGSPDAVASAGGRRGRRTAGGGRGQALADRTGRSDAACGPRAAHLRVASRGQVTGE